MPDGIRPGPPGRSAAGSGLLPEIQCRSELPEGECHLAWRWECISDDLLDGLPPDALRSVEQLGKELAVRESMVFLKLDGLDTANSFM